MFHNAHSLLVLQSIFFYNTLNYFVHTYIDLLQDYLFCCTDHG